MLLHVSPARRNLSPSYRDLFCQALNRRRRRGSVLTEAWRCDVTPTGFRVSETFRQVVGLIRLGEVRISDHGYDELAADGIFARDATTTRDYTGATYFGIMEMSGNVRELVISVWGARTSITRGLK